MGLMGVCGQYLLSSAGPVFYDRIVGGADFNGLAARNAVHAPFVGLGVDVLWRAYSTHSNQVGGGISAMPSMHVATTTWIAVTLTYLSPRLRVPAWGYWLAIFIGSFALGWHYFLDSVVGTVGALSCWVIAGQMLVREKERVENLALPPIG
jgi:hypothetical protein